jgi:hypothetical protein
LALACFGGLLAAFADFRAGCRRGADFLATGDFGPEGVFFLAMFDAPLLRKNRQK